MDKPSFVYTTYIQTTPERLWEALTSSAFTERYWSAAFETDWAPGSEMVWNLLGVRVADPSRWSSSQTRPAACPTRGTPSPPSWPGPRRSARSVFAAAAGEPRSKVTFELEPAGAAVKLTVMHDDFPPRSTAAGW